MELFVQNFPYSTSNDELQRFLEKTAGLWTILECQIKYGALGQCKGFGFVTFEDEDAANRVLAAARSPGLDLGGRRLNVKISNRVPRNPRRRAAVIQDTCLFMGNLRNQNSLEYIWSQQGVRMQAELGKAPRMTLFMTMVGDLERKLEFPFQSFTSVESCIIGGENGLLFQLSYPPRVYSRPSLDGSYLPALLAALMLRDSELVRSVDFTESKAIGQSVAFVLRVPRTSVELMQHFLTQLRDYSLGGTNKKHMDLSEGQSYAENQKLVPFIRSPELRNLPLDIIFKVNYLVQCGYISPAGFTCEFFDLLEPSKTSLGQSLAALAQFERSPTTICDPGRKLRQYLQRNSGRRKSLARVVPEEGQVYVKRLMVTPTKVYCMGPEVEVSNRITRSFPDDIDHFLRVTFCEEDFDKLNANALTPPICRRISSVLAEGVQLGGLEYQFLAYSSSQLKESSVWMFSDTPKTTASSIRNWMGVFDNIKNVAKCAARMGQSFSSSTHTHHVHPAEVDQIRDIERGGHTFSDGIGKISESFARAVAKKVRSLTTVPSAFQIRYGGYKGVVAVDPTSSKKLSLRPSMSKFPSQQTGLDVLSWTKRIPCYLNRQVILLLSTLGVADEVFEIMQANVVEQLDRMLVDATTAREILETSHAGESHRVMDAMLQAGYSPSREPYLASLIRTFRAAQLFMLRVKSRILVPKGRCLMGCLDEYARLSYGQCFVQVSSTPLAEEGWPVHYAGVSGKNCSYVVTGRVVVAKNPCLHPGDVIVLEAVDVPRLHHMVDCIVFPQLGPRPHPDECSGSDLDGDLYFVSWDRGLIPSKIVEPMSYEKAKAKELDHTVTLQEIQKFFLDHMMNNSLGVISNAHLVHADQAGEKALDRKCLELAKLFSVAVDFPKTGVPATFPAELRPTEYPDFLEKQDKDTYESTTILGKLYRSVKEHKCELEGEHGLEEEYDRDLLVAGYEVFLDDAIELKSCYDNKLMGLLNHYDLTEAEALSGSIVKLSRFYSKRQADVRERIVLATSALLKEAREWFNEEEVDEQQELAKAYAWYHITYHPAVRRGLDRKEELLSFPWVVYDRLLKIKRARRRKRE